jgi:diaminohydroxyphosphoribosylaminopyrimidine deaminase/5-amino-6-(5-phosphoribosylamino)uracil reductase
MNGEPHRDPAAAAFHMRAALALARRGLGSTWPNPSVGCVIVAEAGGGAASGGQGRVVGRGHTAPGGRPHAETQALAMAGAAARGATAYVTLEPCCFHGRTPPCTEALIAAGIARVVIGVRDPDPRVNGAGIAQLRAAGIEVVEGEQAEAALEVASGLYTRVRLGRPLVTLKLATTLDGRIATGAGESKWITGEPARRAGHALRGQHDAVLVGVGTVMADDPALTCRLPGYRTTPLVRLIADSSLRTRLTASLVATAAAAPTWVLHGAGVPAERLAAFRDAGVTLIEVAGAPSGIDLGDALARLGAAGLTRVLVEGGAQIAAALLRADLVDRIAWFHAPALMGGDGWPSAEAFGIASLEAMPRFRRLAAQPVGEDMLTELVRPRRPEAA